VTHCENMLLGHCTKLQKYNVLIDIVQFAKQLVKQVTFSHLSERFVQKVTGKLPKALGALLPREQNCLKQAPESSISDVRISNRVRKTVLGGRTSLAAFSLLVPPPCNPSTNAP